MKKLLKWSFILYREIKIFTIVWLRRCILCSHDGFCRLSYKYICDYCICEKKSGNYKYLEILFWNIQLNISIFPEVKQLFTLLTILHQYIAKHSSSLIGRVGGEELQSGWISDPNMHKLNKAKWYHLKPLEI